MTISSDHALEDIVVLFSADAIAARVAELAREIVNTKPRDLLLVPISKGSFVFAADLIRAFHECGFHPEIDFLILSSYGAGTWSKGHIDVLRDVELPIGGRDVMLIDDILELGRTLAHAKGADRGPQRVPRRLLRSLEQASTSRRCG